jgi:trehalose 6-phosphate synthase
MRYEAMMKKLRGHSIQQWFADFVEALRECQSERAVAEPLAETPTLWSLRSAGLATRYH